MFWNFTIWSTFSISESDVLVNRMHGDDVGYVALSAKGMARVEVWRFVEDDLRWEAWFS